MSRRRKKVAQRVEQASELLHSASEEMYQREADYPDDNETIPSRAGVLSDLSYQAAEMARWLREGA